MSATNPEVLVSPLPCGLLRRLASIAYDALLLLGITLLVTLVWVVTLGTEVPAGHIGFQLFLLGIAWLYFALGWRGGQTLGMKSWRISIDQNGQTPSWTALLIRFFVALLSALCLGLGFVWSLFRRDRATWHDLASRTRLQVRPRD